MAPPSSRRPGYSRKAQYSLFAVYVLAITGALLAALLLLLSIVDPRGYSALKTAGDEITAPVSRFLSSVRQTSSDLVDNTSAYFDAASKNAALQKQVEQNRNMLNDAAALKIENDRLRALLDLERSDQGGGVIARLITSTSTSSRNIAVASRGANAGILAGQAVRGPEGLIGRVLSIGPTTSRILLVTDADNVVPVMRAADGVPAFSTGRANGSLEIRPINLGVNPFKVGDIIVTSGNGGLYAPNIPVARISEKITGGAIARPLADPARTPYIMTLPIYQPPAVAAVENGGIEPGSETATENSDNGGDETP